MKKYTNFRLMKFHILLATMSLWSVGLLAQDVPDVEKEALMILYNELDGPNWTNKSGWTTAPNVGDWYGVTVENGHVTRLELFNNKLTGYIPYAIGFLQELEILNLGRNAFFGSIPPSIGALRSLETLNLSGYASENEFGLTGTIPSSLVNLEHLTSLNLGYNRLAGYIPINFQFGQFELFDITWNSFTINDLTPFYLILENVGEPCDTKLLAPASSARNIACPFGISPQSIDLNRTITAIDGEPVILETSIGTDTDSPSSYVWYRRGYGAVSGKDPDNHSFELFEDGSDAINGAQYYVEITNPRLPNVRVDARYIIIDKIDCGSPVPNFKTKNVLCTTIFTPTTSNPNFCRVLSYSWDFGDGNTSDQLKPIHAYAASGDYEATLTITYKCGNRCSIRSESVTKTVTFDDQAPGFEELTVEIPTEQIDQVLQASATTFRESWPLEIESQSSANRNGFLNARQGVWRPDANYTYLTPHREQTKGNRLQTDGTFQLNKFSWEHARFEAIPQWVKANTVTRYSPFGYELENKDVLGIYTAAVYGFNGQLPVALGQNTKNQEIAFTGFETPNIGIDGNAGNWTIGENIPGRYHIYEILSGRDNMVRVNAPTTSLPEIEESVSVYGILSEYTQHWPYLVYWRSVFHNEVEIWCKQEAPDDPDISLLGFDQVINESDYFGYLYFYTPGERSVRPIISDEHAHSGKHSLRLLSGVSTTYKQKKLNLTAGKQYLVSGWISLGNPNAIAVDLKGAGIRIQCLDEDGQVLLTSDLEAASPMIEGWQKQRLVFSVPEGTAGLNLVFIGANGMSAYFDDLRIQPDEAQMQGYVYDAETFRLQATLDENNYATLYYYDEEGQLYLVKKETFEGVKTIQESVNHQAIR